jgi:tRNA threonylcarbamoyladenosine biosynthesis protein TsaB
VYSGKKIICLETSTPVCSVALCDSNGTVAVKESVIDKSHASSLTVFIEELLSDAGIRAGDLDAIAVTRGPGSYTGLRIGISTAKGIAYAASIPLIGIETTLSMYHGITGDIRKKYQLAGNSLYVPMIDARRMEVFYSVFNSEGIIIKKVTAEIIDEKSFTDVPEDVKILIFGDGAPKCSELLKRKNIIIADEFRISAAYMYKPAFKLLSEQHFEDIAYFEPFYLKDFLTSRPKKNILGR